MSALGQLGAALGLGAQGASNGMYGQAHNLAAQQRTLNQQYQQAMNAAVVQGQGVVHTRRDLNPNEHEAFQIPMSQLVTMWQVRFGDKWVDRMSLYDDIEFFRHAHDRLRRADKFEIYADWVRIKEDV